MVMPTPKKPRTAKPLRERRHVVKLAEIAFRELGLASLTHADTERLWRLWRGMEFLDGEQVRLKTSIDDLLMVYDTTKKVGPLLEGLRKLTTPINPEHVEEFEKDLVHASFGDALTMINDRMEDIEDFDELKVKTLLEVLLDKPVKITTSNPRLRSELREREDGFLEEHRVSTNPKGSKA
jgi:hypothetical protein